MKRIVKYVIYFGGWGIISTIIVGMHFKQTILPIHSMLENEQFSEIIYSFSVYKYWLGIDVSGWQNQLYYILFPLICILFSVGYVFFREINIMKLSSSIVIGMTGAIGGILPLVIDFLLSSCYLPSITPDAATIFFCIKPNNFLAEIYYLYPIVYCLCYLLWAGIIGTIMTLIYRELYKIVRSNKITLIIYSICCGVSSWGLCKCGKEKLCYYNLLNAGQPVDKIRIVDWLIFASGLLIILGVLYGYNHKANKEEISC